MRYCIVFSYNGSNYFGYQIQPNQITIQEKLETALSTLLREKIKTTGAGRTDSGVHAKKMYAHFDSNQVITESIIHRLNSFLPSDIAVFDFFKVKDDFHARFDATFRKYEYYISLGKNPFTQDFSWQYWKADLAIERMNEACKVLFEYQDFSSFAKMGADNKTNNCEIYEAKWEQYENGLKFTIAANRFLRNMVRAIVGTMVEIGKGHLSTDDFRKIIEEKNRSSAGVSAPAQGLFLVDVGYEF